MAVLYMGPHLRTNGGVEESQNKKKTQVSLAMTYSSTPLPGQYHRR
jgi:hypothetical protein